MKLREVNLYYVSEGTAIPLVFIHPPVLTSTSFSVQIEGLSKQFQVIAFDVRGHGKSSASHECLTYAVMASDIVELLNGLGIDKALICGYSTGGSAVLEFLLRHPHRAFGRIVIGGMSEVHDLRLAARITLGSWLAKLDWMHTLAFGLAWSNSVRGHR